MTTTETVNLEAIWDAPFCDDRPWHIVRHIADDVAICGATLTGLHAIPRTELPDATVCADCDRLAKLWGWQ